MSGIRWYTSALHWTYFCFRWKILRCETFWRKLSWWSLLIWSHSHLSYHLVSAISLLCDLIFDDHIIRVAFVQLQICAIETGSFGVFSQVFRWIFAKGHEKKFQHKNDFTTRRNPNDSTRKTLCNWVAERRKNNIEKVKMLKGKETQLGSAKSVNWWRSEAVRKRWRRRELWNWLGILSFTFLRSRGWMEE